MANHLLMLGFGSFERKNDFRQLTSGNNNFSLIRSVLSDQKRPIVPPENVRDPLLDEDASTARSRISKLYREADAGDNLYIYVTGHGVNHVENNDLIVPSKHGRLSTIRESRAYDAEISLSLQSDFVGKKTKAASVNLILDCCHAAAAVAKPGTANGIAKDATGTAFDEAIQVVNGIDHRLSDEGSPAFTYLLASDVAGKAYDIPIDLHEWETGVYAEELSSLELDFEAHFSRLALALFQISRVESVMERDASDIETLGSGKRIGLFLSACKARDVDLALTEDDDGMVSLGSAEYAIAKAVANEFPKQCIRIVDPHDIASNIPLFFRKASSRAERLDTISRFLDSHEGIFTSKTKSRIDDFLLTASRKTINERSEVQLDLETRLFEAAKADKISDFTETFILREYDRNLKSEVNAAVKRKLEKSDKVGMHLSKTIETKEQDLIDLKTAISKREIEVETEKRKLEAKVWRWRLATLLVFVFMCVIGLIVLSSLGFDIRQILNARGDS